MRKQASQGSKLLAASIFTRWRFCSTWLLFLLATASWTAAAPLSVKPGAAGSGKAYVSSVFDGVKNDCLLDTGSAMTLLKDAPAFAGRTNLGVFQFKSAAGVVKEAERVQIGVIQIDDVEFPKRTVGLLKDVPQAENTLGIDIIGQDPFSLQIKPKPVLELRSKPSFPLRRGLDVSPHGLLSVPVTLGGSSSLALWDTGAALTVVDQALVKARPAEFKKTRSHMQGFDGAGQNLLAPVYRAKEIIVGGRAFRNIYVVALDLSMLRQGVNGQIQAVLGFNVIQKAVWYFDPGNKLWSLR